MGALPWSLRRHPLELIVCPLAAICFLWSWQLALLSLLRIWTHAHAVAVWFPVYTLVVAAGFVVAVELGSALAWPKPLWVAAPVAVFVFVPALARLFGTPHPPITLFLFGAERTFFAPEPEWLLLAVLCYQALFLGRACAALRPAPDAPDDEQQRIEAGLAAIYRRAWPQQAQSIAYEEMGLWFVGLIAASWLSAHFGTARTQLDFRVGADVALVSMCVWLVGVGGVARLRTWLDRGARVTTSSQWGCACWVIGIVGLAAAVSDALPANWIPVAGVVTRVLAWAAPLLAPRGRPPSSNDAALHTQLGERVRLDAGGTSSHDPTSILFPFFVVVGLVGLVVVLFLANRVWLYGIWSAWRRPGAWRRFFRFLSPRRWLRAALRLRATSARRAAEGQVGRGAAASEVQRLAESGEVRDLFARLLREGAAAGWPRQPSETALEYTRRLAGFVPEAADALEQLREAYVSERYAFARQRGIGEAARAWFRRVRGRLRARRL